jgi:hypothetical protein
VALLAVVAAVLTLTLDGATVRMPALRRPAWTDVLPVVVPVRRGAGVYARDLRLLAVS